MNFKDLFKKGTTDWFNGEEKQYDVNQGKADRHSFNKIFIFIPFGVTLSCLAIIIAVVGAPTTMQIFKTGLASVYDREVLRPVAEEIVFEDVKGNSKYFDSLFYLKKKGMVSGFKDNTFRPDQKINRAEFVKTIVNARKLFPLALNYNNCFKDVKNQWFAPSICLAKERGWIKGYGELFNPTGEVTREEARGIVTKAFDMKAYPADVLDDSEKLENQISRGQAFQMLYRVLQL